MGTAIGLLVVFVVVLLVAAAAFFLTSAYKMRGHERCAYCRARLKFVAGQYVAVCQQCGRTQPWADDLVGHGRH